MRWWCVLFGHRWNYWSAYQGLTADPTHLYSLRACRRCGKVGIGERPTI